MSTKHVTIEYADGGRETHPNVRALDVYRHDDADYTYVDLVIGFAKWPVYPSREKEQNIVRVTVR